MNQIRHVYHYYGKYTKDNPAFGGKIHEVSIDGIADLDHSIVSMGDYTELKKLIIEKMSLSCVASDFTLVSLSLLDRYGVPESTPSGTESAITKVELIDEKLSQEEED